MIDDRLPHDPKLRPRSADEVEGRIRETRASLSTKVAALADEFRSQMKTSIDRVTEKVEGSVEQVSGGLDRSLEHVTQAMDQAALEMRRAVDVKRHVHQAPLRSFAVSVGVGLILSQLLDRRQAKRVEIRRSVLPEPRLHMSPWALVGLAGGVLRPVLVATARNFVVNALQGKLAANAFEKERASAAEPREAWTAGRGYPQ